MQFTRLATRDELNQYVGKKLNQCLRQGSQKSHFLPTGTTFLEPYRILREQLEQQDGSAAPDFSQLSLINLDEYLDDDGIPLTLDDARSFSHYMKPTTEVLTRFGFNRTQHYFPYSLRGMKPLQVGDRFPEFDAMVKDSSFHSAFLGLGPKESPHIAFCAPGYCKGDWRSLGALVTRVDSATRKANKSNKGMEGSEVPELACTISPGNLLAAAPEKVFLVAYGPQKDLSVLEKDADISENPAGILKLLAYEKGAEVEVITLA